MPQRKMPKPGPTMTPEEEASWEQWLLSHRKREPRYCPTCGQEITFGSNKYCDELCFLFSTKTHRLITLTEERFPAGTTIPYDDFRALVHDTPIDESQARRVLRKSGWTIQPKYPEDSHGAYGYRRRGCRCATCKAGHAEVQRRWYARKKEAGNG